MIKTNEFQNEKELYYTIGKNIKYYRKLYDELVQSSQNKEEKLCDEIFKVEEENSELKKEIGILRQIIFELSGLLIK